MFLPNPVCLSLHLDFVYKLHRAVAGFQGGHRNPHGPKDFLTKNLWHILPLSLLLCCLDYTGT